MEAAAKRVVPGVLPEHVELYCDRWVWRKYGVLTGVVTVFLGVMTVVKGGGAFVFLAIAFPLTLFVWCVERLNHRTARLRLSRVGIEEWRWGHRFFIAWCDVESLGLVGRAMTSVIGVRRVVGKQAEPWLGRAYDYTLQDTYEVDPPYLLAVMESYRYAAVREAAAQGAGWALDEVAGGEHPPLVFPVWRKRSAVVLLVCFVLVVVCLPLGFLVRPLAFLLPGAIVPLAVGVWMLLRLEERSNFLRVSWRGVEECSMGRLRSVVWGDVVRVETVVRRGEERLCVVPRQGSSLVVRDSYHVPAAELVAKVVEYQRGLGERPTSARGGAS